MSFDIWVEYNDISTKHRTTTLAKFANKPIQVGDIVLTGDHEGNTCLGMIIDIYDSPFVEDCKLVEIQLDMDQFKGEQE